MDQQEPWMQLLSEDVLIPLFAITLAFCLGGTALLGGLLIGMVKAFRGGGGAGGKHSKAMEADETRSFQELERGFRRLEQRVESLETLILDRNTESHEARRDK